VPGRQDDHVLQQRDRLQLLRLRVAEGAEHVDVIVRPHPKTDRIPLLHIDRHCPAFRVDHRREVHLARSFEVREQDRIACLQRDQHALPDRIVLDGPVLLHLHVRIRDEPPGQLADRDHVPGKLGSFGDVP